MASDKKCCVPGCVKTDDSEPLHAFPNPTKDLERFKIWVSSVGGHLSELSTDHIYKYRRVCRLHFEKKFWCRCNRLSNIAIPTLSMPEKNASVIDLASEQSVNDENVPLDHGALFPNYLTSVSRQFPLQSVENYMLIAPSTSRDLTSVSRKRPLVSTENAMLNVPSTSKDDTNTRRRNIVKKRFMTPLEQALYKKLNLAKVNMCKYKNKSKKQAAAIKAAKNVINQPNLLKALENLPKAAKILTLLQIRENKKKCKGRRFSHEEKFLALSLCKQSPKGYRLLRKIFLLPAPQTLSKLIAKADIHPGVSERIFSQLKLQGEKMKSYEKICILLFDEMALKSSIMYNERLDEIIGFVDNGARKTLEFADHAQVFMIRGVLKNYKQPIGYTFSASATKGPELANQIKTYVRELKKAGFNVVATVCDQGSGNRNAIKYLIEESRGEWLRGGKEPVNNTILIDGCEIVPLYDPPHLMKCIRNNLLTKNLNYKNNSGELKTAKWSHIQLLYNENPAYQGVRLMPKLTENHVMPAKIGKMKVKYATQIFSQTVATNMGYLADKGILPEECKDTADILLFFDKLFDSMNGSFNKKYRFAKPALGPATPKSIHFGIWREAKIMLKNMSFINRNGKKESVPSLNNWVWTLDGLELLLKNLNTRHGVGSVWMRHLNQDPLENFFGLVRSHGCRNTNPTPDRFESAFATLLINSLSRAHALGSNCENDFADSLHALVINEDCKATKKLNIDEKVMSQLNNINLVPIEEKICNPKKKATLEYCSGYFAKKTQVKIFKNCKVCKKDFINQNECEYISYREFEKKRWLCSPTLEFLTNVSQMQDIIYLILKTKLEINFIKELIKTIILMAIDFDFINCNEHKEKNIEFLINCVSRFFIYNHCKNINKILVGRRNLDDDEDMFQVKAKQYFVKSRKTRLYKKQYKLL